MREDPRGLAAGLGSRLPPPERLCHALRSMLPRLLAALWLLLSSLVPAGTNLCVSRTAGVELESSDRPCCGDTARDDKSGELGHPARDRGCDQCTDYPVGTDQLRAAIGPSIHVMVSVSAPAWLVNPQCVRLDAPRLVRPAVRVRDPMVSGRLSALRTVVIRC